MILQLVQKLSSPTTSAIAAGQAVLASDPLDLVLYMEQVWDLADGGVNDPPAGARKQLYEMGRFGPPPSLPLPQVFGLWDHFAYAYVLESTRAVQILRRVIREYRSGESLGIPSPATRRWIEATETLLFGAANPIAPWLSTSSIRQDSEAVRRNAYWRMFGLDLAFGAEDNSAPVFDRSATANTSFPALFEELLFELWQAISNQRNFAGVNQSDDDRIFRIAEQLRFVLRSRRQNDMLRREELAAATALGWAELTFAFDSPVVKDLGADASSPGDRLRIVGERVGLPSHSKAAAFFSMASEISILMRVIEAGLVSDTTKAWLLYATTPVPGPNQAPFGAESRRVITEWAAASGKNLKERSRPVDVRTPRLVAVR